MENDPDKSLSQRLLSAAGIGQKSGDGNGGEGTESKADDGEEDPEEEEDEEYENKSDELEELAVELSQVYDADADVVHEHLMAALEEGDTDTTGENGEMKSDPEGSDGDLETKLEEMGFVTEDQVDQKLNTVRSEISENVDSKLDSKVEADEFESKLESLTSEIESEVESISQKANTGSTPDPSSGEEETTTHIGDGFKGESE